MAVQVAHLPKIFIPRFSTDMQADIVNVLFRTSVKATVVAMGTEGESVLRRVSGRNMNMKVLHKMVLFPR